MIEVVKPILKSINRGYPIYFKEHNQVYLPVFKCGYTSSHKAYCPIGKVLASFNDLIDYDGVEKVTMVRSPFARVASLWTSKNNRDRLHERSGTFAVFVDNIGQLLDDGFQDGHYNTLVQNLSIHGRFMPNTIFKLEEKEKLVAHLPKIKGEFPKMNESKNKQPDYQSYYTPEIVTKVTDIYQEDLDMFGYTYE